MQFIPKHVDLPKAGLFIDPPPKWRFPVIFRDLLNLLSVKFSKVNNNKLKLFRSVQIKGQIWVRVGKFESNRNYMGRLNSGIRIRDNFLSEWFFLFQKIEIDSVNHADSRDQTFDSITLESILKFWPDFLRLSSQKTCSGLVSLEMILKPLQSELFRFKFHILSSKILKIRALNLYMG